MLFHYGNCKNEIHELKRRETDLVNQIQELKAMYDYSVGVQETEIARLKLKRNVTCECKDLSLEHAALNSEIVAQDIEMVRIKKENEELKADLKRFKKNAKAKREVDRANTFVIHSQAPRI